MSIIPKIPKLVGLISIEKERLLKKFRGESEYLLSQIGQENEKKAIPLVKEYAEEEHKKEKTEEENQIDVLKFFISNKRTYIKFLIDILNKFVSEENMPSTYKIIVDANLTGIAIGIEGTKLYRAFKICGDPKYDVSACKTLAIQVGNTVGKLEGNFKKTESGINLPTKKEFEILKNAGN